MAPSRKYLEKKYCQNKESKENWEPVISDKRNLKGVVWRPWEPINCQKSVTPLPLKLQRERKDEGSLGCSFSDCKSRFKRESELKRHVESIHRDHQEICNVCEKKFTRKDNLTRHFKLKHGISAKFKPRCNICSKLLSRQDAVQRHVKTCREKRDKKSLNFNRSRA